MQASPLFAPFSFFKIWSLLLLCLFIAALCEAKVKRPANAVAQPDSMTQFSFERNDGQTSPEVSFLGRLPDGVIYLTDDSAVLAVRNKSTGDLTPITMRLIGDNRIPIPQGIGKMQAVSNYFIGADPKQWHTDVPHFARVRYAGVYAGIDLSFYGNEDALEYDFIVHPSASPKTIRLTLEGIDHATISNKGDLLLEAKDAHVRWQKPKAYQLIDGRRVPVHAKYVKLASGAVGFSVGDYDRDRALIIDPVLQFSTFLGGSGHDEATGIALGPNRNIYVTGTTDSLNFPTRNAIRGASGFEDVFVSKLDPTGAHLIFSTYLGGTSSDLATGIAVDKSGNAYVTGQTYSIVGAGTFPVTSNAFMKSAKAAAAFLAKLSPGGQNLLYSTLFGGSLPQSSSGVALDGSAHAYIAGFTESTDLPTTAGAFQRTHNGGDEDGFIAKFDTTLAGNASLLAATYLGGTGIDAVDDIAVDPTGNAFVISLVNSADFPTTPSAFSRTGGVDIEGSGDFDAAVTNLSPGLSSLLYSTYLGGFGSESARGIAIDPNGNVYAAGSTRATNFPTTPGAFQRTLRGEENAFVAKLNPAGFGFGSLIYASYLGGTGGDRAFAVTADAAGRAYVTGLTTSSDFPLRRPFQADLRGGNDAFVTRFNVAGSDLLLSSFLGSANGSEEQGTAITLDSSLNIYVAGRATARTFPVILGSFQRTYGGGSSDAFVTKVQNLCATNTQNRTVFICSPGGTVTTSPMRIVAETTDTLPVTLIQLYVDGKQVAAYHLTSIEAFVLAAPGPHRITVIATDAIGTFRETITIDVQ